MPQAAFQPCPEIIFAIHIKVESSTAKRPFSITPDIAIANRAEFAQRYRCCTGPDSPLVVFHYRVNKVILRLVISPESTIFPTRQSFTGSNPQRSVMPGS